MHTLWQKLNSAETIIFLDRQKVFCREEFDPAKLTLSKVPLSFFQGYFLIRAEIEPHVVKLADGASIEIAEPAQSYFLYNPSTDDLLRMIIPLSPRASDVYQANRLLRPKIDESTVVEYVKYFGMIVENRDSSEPFHFIDRESEIPWTASVDPSERDRLIGNISASNPRLPDGRFDVRLSEDRDYSWLLGTAYSLKIPSIHSRTAFAATMQVGKRGQIAMRDDAPVTEEKFSSLVRERQYYEISPTMRLKSFRFWQGLRAALLLAAIALPLMALVPVSLYSNVIALVGFYDTLAGYVSESWISGIGDWLAERRFWLWLALVGSGASVAAILFENLFLRVAEFVAGRRPGFCFYLYTATRENLQNRYNTLAKRIRGILVQAIFRAVLFVSMWGVMFFSLNSLGMKVFAEPAALDLRSTIAYAFSQVTRWFMRGEELSYLSDFIRTFTPVEQLTFLGATLQSLMLISIPFVVIPSIIRIWRWTRPNEAYWKRGE